MSAPSETNLLPNSPSTSEQLFELRRNLFKAQSETRRLELENELLRDTGKAKEKDQLYQELATYQN